MPHTRFRLLLGGAILSLGACSEPPTAAMQGHPRTAPSAAAPGTKPTPRLPTATPSDLLNRPLGERVAASASAARGGEVLVHQSAGSVPRAGWTAAFGAPASFFDPNFTYVAHLRPLWGDPDLLLLGWDGWSWRVMSASQQGPGREEVVEYTTDRNPGVAWIYFWVYGYDAGGFEFTLRANPRGGVAPASFLWPLEGDQSRYTVSQEHGADWHTGNGIGNRCASRSSAAFGRPWRHTGIDIGNTQEDQVVRAAFSGTIRLVYDAGNDPTTGAWWGQGIVVEDDAGTMTATYLHLIAERRDGPVARGQALGRLARIRGRHLHFALRDGPFDPIARRGALPPPGCSVPNVPEFPERFFDPLTKTFSAN